MSARPPPRCIVQRRSEPHPSLLREWKWELVGFLFTILSLGAMIATLYVYTEKPFPRLPFGISFNALLSIYAVIFKTAILFILASSFGQLQWQWFFTRPRPLSDIVKFDDASRGPWGAFLLVCSQRLRQPLSILACLVMVASIAVDPCVQELIVSWDCSILLYGTTGLPRANVVERFNPMVEGYRSSVSQGIYGSQIDVPYQCSTGNCTFGPFTTLGFCSSCEDISSQVTIGQDPHQYAMTPQFDPSSHSFKVTSSLPSGTNVTYDDEGAFGSLQLGKFAMVSNENPSSVGITFETLFNANPWSAAARSPVTGERLPGCEKVKSWRSWECAGFGAARCMLEPCVRSYHGAEIRAGILTEQLAEISIVGASTANMSGPFNYGSVDLECASATDKEKLSRIQGLDVKASGRWLPLQISENSPINGLERREDLVTSLLRSKCLYLMDYWAPQDIRSVFEYNIFGTGDIYLDGYYPPQGGNDVSIAHLILGSEAIKHVYYGGSVDFEQIEGTFANISDSITRYFRTKGNATWSEPAMGETLHYATCLRVPWLWIVYPISLAALASVLLFCVMSMEIQGRREQEQGSSAVGCRLPAWKASPLAWQFHGPGPYRLLAQGQAPPMSLIVMEDESKRIDVQPPIVGYEK